MAFPKSRSGPSELYSHADWLRYRYSINSLFERRSSNEFSVPTLTSQPCSNEHYDVCHLRIFHLYARLSELKKGCFLSTGSCHYKNDVVCVHLWRHWAIGDLPIAHDHDLRTSVYSVCCGSAAYTVQFVYFIGRSKKRQRASR